MGISGGFMPISVKRDDFSWYRFCPTPVSSPGGGGMMPRTAAARRYVVLVYARVCASDGGTLK